MKIRSNVVDGGLLKTLARVQGFRMPENYNPAEYIADLISTDTSSHEAEAASRSAPDCTFT